MELFNDQCMPIYDTNQITKVITNSIDNKNSRNSFLKHKRKYISLVTSLHYYNQNIFLNPYIYILKFKYFYINILRKSKVVKKF